MKYTFSTKGTDILIHNESGDILMNLTEADVEDFVIGIRKQRRLLGKDKSKKTAEDLRKELDSMTSILIRRPGPGAGLTTGTHAVVRSRWQNSFYVQPDRTVCGQDPYTYYLQAPIAGNIEDVTCMACLRNLKAALSQGS